LNFLTPERRFFDSHKIENLRQKNWRTQKRRKELKRKGKDRKKKLEIRLQGLESNINFACQCFFLPVN